MVYNQRRAGILDSRYRPRKVKAQENGLGMKNLTNILIIGESHNVQWRNICIEQGRLVSIEKGQKSSKRKVLGEAAGDGCWQRGTKTRINTMVENKNLLRSSKNSSFDNVIFLLKVYYTSALKTPVLGGVLYFTV